MIKARHYLLLRYFHALAMSRQIPTGITWGDSEERAFGSIRSGALVTDEARRRYKIAVLHLSVYRATTGNALDFDLGADVRTLLNFPSIDATLKAAIAQQQARDCLAGFQRRR